MIQMETFTPPTDPHIARGVMGFPTDCPPERVILGNGWLRMGDAATFISTAGAGKSVGITQAAYAWGLGFPYFGIQPTRPLRVLLFSGEDDDVTLGQCREGFLEHSEAITGKRLIESDLETLDRNLRTDFSREHVGNQFHVRLPKLLEQEPADLVLVNPLFSYIGGDIVANASEWFRVWLLPLLQQFECAAIVASHTNRMTTKSWDEKDDVYSGIGGSEMANIPRSVLTLRPTKANGLFELKVGKRQTTGWKDGDDKFTPSYFVKRSDNPERPAWLPVDYDEAEELIGEAAPAKGKRKADASDVVTALKTGAMKRPDLLAAVQSQARCGLSAAKDALKDARTADPPLVAEWSEKNPKGGHRLIWFCLPEHKEQWSK